MQYITPTDYETAEANGLSKELVYSRVHVYGWAIVDAITIPKRITKKRSEWYKIAMANGVSDSTYYARLKKGLTEQEAALMPVKPKHDMRELVEVSANKRRTYPKAYLILAASNGISQTTLRERLKRGWSLEVAATYPTMQRGERKVIRDARANRV